MSLIATAAGRSSSSPVPKTKELLAKVQVSAPFRGPKKQRADPHRHLVVLFPADSHTYKDYRALATWYKDQVDAGVGRGSEEGLFFCVCVNYGSSVGDANYQTGFIFQPLRDVGEALLRVGFKDTEVPLKKLRLGLGGRPVEIFTN